MGVVVIRGLRYYSVYSIVGGVRINYEGFGEIWVTEYWRTDQLLFEGFVGVFSWSFQFPIREFR